MYMYYNADTMYSNQKQVSTKRFLERNLADNRDGSMIYALADKVHKQAEPWTQ